MPPLCCRHICSFSNSCNVSSIVFANNLFVQRVPFEAGWWMANDWGRIPCAKGLCGWKGLVLAHHNLWYVAETSLGPLVMTGEPATLEFDAANFSALTALTHSGIGAVVGKDPRLIGLLGGGRLSNATDMHPAADSPARGVGVAVGWARDFDGRPIPPAGAVDIGPYQTQQMGVEGLASLLKTQ